MSTELGRDIQITRHSHDRLRHPERKRPALPVVSWSKTEVKVDSKSADPERGSSRFLSRSDDRVAEAARRSRYFMGRRPRIIPRPVTISDEVYKMQGSNAYRFMHFLKGAIYVSTRRSGGSSRRK